MNHICEQYQLEMSERIDNEQQLTPDIKQHLESCGDCKEFYGMWNPSAASNSLSSVALDGAYSQARVDRILSQLPGHDREKVSEIEEMKIQPQQKKSKNLFLIYHLSLF